MGAGAGTAPVSMPHILLTRFNVASPGREVAVRNTPGWLERRFDLFERYCLPSVAANGAHDFTWLIYFDEATPAAFRARIEAARRVHPFVPCFVGMLDKVQVVAEVRRHLPRGATRLLTTRLDNDDAIASDYLARCAHVAEGLEDGTVINFLHGAALARGRLFDARDASNPFCSLVEAEAGLRTVWAVPHDRLGAEFRILQVAAPPSWLQVVHGDNVTNRIKGRQLADTAIAGRFAIADRAAIRPAGTAELLFDRAVLHPWRRLRECLVRAGKRLLRR